MQIPKIIHQVWEGKQPLCLIFFVNWVNHGEIRIRIGNMYIGIRHVWIHLYMSIILFIWIFIINSHMMLCVGM